MIFVDFFCLEILLVTFGDIPYFRIFFVWDISYFRKFLRDSLVQKIFSVIFRHYFGSMFHCKYGPISPIVAIWLNMYRNSILKKKTDLKLLKKTFKKIEYICIAEKFWYSTKIFTFFIFSSQDQTICSR